MFFANDEVVANQDARDRAEKSGITDKPDENIASVACHYFPGLHGNTDEAGYQATGAKADASRRKIGEIVGGGDHVCGDVDVERGHEQGEHGGHDSERMAEAREAPDRIPERLTEDDERSRRYGDADEGVKGHRGGQAERL